MHYGRQRLVEAFLVVGAGEEWGLHRDAPKIPADEGAGYDAKDITDLRFEPRVEQVYPKRGLENLYQAEVFCLPEGVRVKEGRVREGNAVRTWNLHDDRAQLFPYVLTSREGRRLYGTSLVFWDAVDKQTSQPRLWQQVGVTEDPRVTMRRNTCHLVASKAISIVSKYPLLHVLKELLLHIYRSLGGGHWRVEQLVQWMIDGIRLPTSPSCLQLMMGSKALVIPPLPTRPAATSPLPAPAGQHVLAVLFDTVYHQTILLMLQVLFLEKQVMLLASSKAVVAQVIVALCALLDPVNYVHVCIPLLPSWKRLRSITTAPVPYLIGVFTEGDGRAANVDFAAVNAFVFNIDTGEVRGPADDLPPALPDRLTASLRKRLALWLKGFDIAPPPADSSGGRPPPYRVGARMATGNYDNPVPRSQGAPPAAGVLPCTHHSFPGERIRKAFREYFTEVLAHAVTGIAAARRGDDAGGGNAAGATGGAPAGAPMAGVAVTPGAESPWAESPQSRLSPTFGEVSTAYNGAGELEQGAHVGGATTPNAIGAKSPPVHTEPPPRRGSGYSSTASMGFKALFRGASGDGPPMLPTSPRGGGGTGNGGARSPVYTFPNLSPTQQQGASGDWGGRARGGGAAAAATPVTWSKRDAKFYTALCATQLAQNYAQQYRGGGVRAAPQGSWLDASTVSGGASHATDPTLLSVPSMSALGGRGHHRHTRSTSSFDVDEASSVGSLGSVDRVHGAFRSPRASATQQMKTLVNPGVIDLMGMQQPAAATAPTAEPPASNSTVINGLHHYTHFPALGAEYMVPAEMYAEAMGFPTADHGSGAGGGASVADADAEGGSTDDKDPSDARPVAPEVTAAAWGTVIAAVRGVERREEAGLKVLRHISTVTIPTDAGGGGEEQAPAGMRGSSAGSPAGGSRGGISGFLRSKFGGKKRPLSRRSSITLEPRVSVPGDTGTPHARPAHSTSTSPVPMPAALTMQTPEGNNLAVSPCSSLASSRGGSPASPTPPHARRVASTKPCPAPLDDATATSTTPTPQASIEATPDSTCDLRPHTHDTLDASFCSRSTSLTVNMMCDVTVDTAGAIMISNAQDETSHLTFNTTVTCPKCSMLLSYEQLNASTVDGDTYSVGCCGCAHVFVPYFTVLVRTTVGGTPVGAELLNVQHLSTALLVKECSNLMQRQVNVDADLLTRHPTTFWNVMRLLRDPMFSVPIPFEMVLPQVDWLQVHRVLYAKTQG